jgi:site-specific DNA-methyltransferase (adenine-specific)
VGHSPKRFTTAHRSILHVRKSARSNFYKDQVAQPYKNPDDRRIKQRLADGHSGRMPYSWFYYDLVKNVSKDKTFHACQIPLQLVEMLIKSCTVEGDDVFVLFAGSGSELILASDLKRNFISCELHPEYYSMIQDSLKNGGLILKNYSENQ